MLKKKPYNIDSDLRNADWPKRTPDSTAAIKAGAAKEKKR